MISFNKNIINNGVPVITGSGGERLRPNAGLPYQLFLDVINGYMQYDNGTIWQTLKANPINPYYFSTGLTVFDYIVTNNVVTGVGDGQTQWTGSILSGGQLTIAAALTGDGHLYFGTTGLGNVSSFHEDSGNWNFDGQTDMGYKLYTVGNVLFGKITAQSLLVSGAGGAGFLNFTRQSSAPSEVASKTIFFADSTGRLSWFNGTGSYLRTFDATSVTAARVWTLPDATTMLAGLNVEQTFTQVQTIGTASATTAQLVVIGGSGGNSIISLRRTSGSTNQFDWALTGGGLSFNDGINGGTTTNIYGDNSKMQLYIGQRNVGSASGVTLNNCVLGATTFASSSGNNNAGVLLTIQGSLGTGNAQPGSINFDLGTITASGSTQQTASTKMTIYGLYGNVGIGTTTPVASAKLELTSTTQGFLVPRMTTTQKNAISSPSKGLMIFDTTLVKMCLYNGASWETITSI